MRLAICGKANSGKDALASTLKSLNSNFKILGFADHLKKVAKCMFPQMIDENLYGPSPLRECIIPNTNVSYRQSLLDLGKLGRSYSLNFWFNSISQEIATSSDLIVKDLRFINEYEFLKSNNFYFIRIKRQDHTVVPDVSDMEQDELSDNMFDFIIKNDKDLAYLCDQSQTILRENETRQKLLSNSF